MGNDNRDEVNAALLRILEKGRSQGIDTLNEVQRTVFLVLELRSFTEADGLFGIYPAMGGDQAMEAVDALARIGAHQSAELIRQANSIFPSGRPSADMDELHRDLNGLDDSAFQAINGFGYQFLERAENFTAQVDAYIQSNSEALMRDAY